MAYETERWPTIPAKYFGAQRTSAPRLVVIHTPEWKETLEGAEGLGRYLAAPESPKSYHIGVDADSIVQYVPDSFVAWAAPGANHDGLQVSIVGYASQTRSAWLDKFSLCAVTLAADAVAQYCLKYFIPRVKLTDHQLQDGARGIVGHDQVSRIYRKSTHTDPGPDFPWTRFIRLVESLHAERM